VAPGIGATVDVTGDASDAVSGALPCWDRRHNTSAAAASVTSRRAATAIGSADDGLRAAGTASGVVWIGAGGLARAGSGGSGCGTGSIQVGSTSGVVTGRSGACAGCVATGTGNVSGATVTSSSAAVGAAARIDVTSDGGASAADRVSAARNSSAV
jgi:hypothetical protein